MDFKRQVDELQDDLDRERSRYRNLRREMDDVLESGNTGSGLMRNNISLRASTNMMKSASSSGDLDQ